MKEIIILIACITGLIVALISLINKPGVLKKEMPEELDRRLRRYFDLALAKLTVSVKDLEMSNFKELAEVTFDDGQFEFYSFDYVVSTDKAVQDKNGLVLNTTEMLKRCGLVGEPILYFFRSDDQMYEINFVQEREIAARGYKGLLSARYNFTVDFPDTIEYALIYNGKSLRLWDNLMGYEPYDGFIKTVDRNETPLGEAIKRTDTWEYSQTKVQTMVIFQRKKEYVYWISTKNPYFETVRGIHVGSSIADLKNAYGKTLNYDSDFKGGGPCYGYVPEDGTNCYIAFYAIDGHVSEIWVTMSFDDRPFAERDKYIDNDVPWVFHDNSEKFTERFAREMYVGQHKSETDVDKVYQSFVAHMLLGVNVIHDGIMEEQPGERMYYIKCEKKDRSSGLNVEVVLKRVTLPASVTNERIWVVERYRSQKIMY